MDQAAARILFSLPGELTTVVLVVCFVFGGVIGLILWFKLPNNKRHLQFTLIATFAPPILLVAFSAPDRWQRATCVADGGRRSIEMGQKAAQTARPGETVRLEGIYEADGRARRQTWRVGGGDERLLVSVSPYCTAIVRDWKSAAAGERKFGLTFGCGRMGQSHWCSVR